MKAHSIIFNACVLISAACLSVGYVLSGYWLIAVLLFAIAIFWLIMKTRLTFFSASSLLSICVFLAAMGLVVNLFIPLMVIGCIAALASWDLAVFGQSVLGNPPHEAKASLERYHLQSLAVATFASLLLIFASSYIDLHFQFGVMAFLAVIAVGCITYGLQRIMK